MNISLITYISRYTVGRLFQGLQILQMEQEREFVEITYFHKITLAELFTVHVNLHAMEFPLIFGKTNFMKVPKICKICKIYGPRRKSTLRYICNNVTQYSTCIGPYCSSLVLL